MYAEDRLWLAELMCVCVPAGLRTSTGGDVQTPSGSTAQSPSRLMEKALRMCTPSTVCWNFGRIRRIRGNPVVSFLFLKQVLFLSTIPLLQNTFLCNCISFEMVLLCVISVCTNPTTYLKPVQHTGGKMITPSFKPKGVTSEYHLVARM